MVREGRERCKVYTPRTREDEATRYEFHVTPDIVVDTVRNPARTDRRGEQSPTTKPASGNTLYM